MNCIIKKIVFVLIFVLLIPSTLVFPIIEHHSDVVKSVRAKFREITTYQANFYITKKSSQKVRRSSGKLYYKANGKIFFDFLQPQGDQIISNSKKIWIYLKGINSVAVQKLSGESSSIYEVFSDSGLTKLFSKYHITFDGIQQPTKIKKRKTYKLLLKEKVKLGAFETIILYIDATSHLIYKVQADTYSKDILTLQLKNIQIDKEIKDYIFNFRVKGNMNVLENALTTEY